MSISFPSLILKNQTAADITYTAIGITVPASGQVTVPFASFFETSINQDLISDIRGHLIFVNDGTADRADARALDFLTFLAQISIEDTYSNLTGNSTTTVKSGMGILTAILIGNNTTGGTATIYDNTAASGTKIATLTFGTPSGGLLSSSGQFGPAIVPVGAGFATGLTVVLAGSTSNNITLVYR